MDEVLRAKRLTEEILRRAASIKESMSSVQEKMANIQLIEKQAAEKQAVLSRPTLKLMDLPEDCLYALVSSVREHASLCALAQTCTRFQVLVYSDWKGWEARCRVDWGVTEHSPDQVPRLDTGLFVDRQPQTTHRNQQQATMAQQRLSSPGGDSGSAPMSPTSVGHAGGAGVALGSPGATQARVSGSGGGGSGGSSSADVGASSMDVDGARGCAASTSQAPSGLDMLSGGFDMDYVERGSRGSRPIYMGQGIALAWAQLSAAAGAAGLGPHARSGGRLGGSSGAVGGSGMRTAGSLNQRGGAGGAGGKEVGGGARGAGGAVVLGAVAEERAPSEALVAATAAPGNLWRLVYQDRHKGWQLVRQTLTWLRAHNHPRSVTGSVHRLQLVLSLRYMVLGTGQPGDTPRKQQVEAVDGVRSLLALLDNESAQVVEMALHVLANLMQGDADARIQILIGSRMGKLFTDRLELGGGKQPGVVQAAARALVTMWTEGLLPEVVPLDDQNRPAVPPLEPGLWHLQEFTLRGECMQMVHIFLSFEEGVGSTVRLIGTGLDNSDGSLDEFDVSGSVDLATRAWTWQRRSRGTQHQTILYRGYSDAHGSFGCYAAQRADGSAASFLVSSSRQPRVYRLYRSTDAVLSPAGSSGLPTAPPNHQDVPVLLSPPRSSDGGSTRGSAGGNVSALSSPSMVTR